MPANQINLLSYSTVPVPLIQKSPMAVVVALEKCRMICQLTSCIYTQEYGILRSASVLHLHPVHRIEMRFTYLLLFGVEGQQVNDEFYVNMT